MKKTQLFTIAIEIIILVGILFGSRYLNTVMNRRKPIAPAVEEEKQSAGAVAVEAENEIDRGDLSFRKPGYTNYLLVGLDVRNQSRMDYANSDTMIIASINNVSGNVRLVSVYRDTIMNIEEDDEILRLKSAESEIENVITGTYDEYDNAYYIGQYNKANAAYAQGGAEQAIAMMENNLDIKIDGYATVNFSAVADMIDDLDGIDVWMTKQEVIHMNNYCVETSATTEKEYTPITPQEEATEYHLNGVQAVSYARIRYTAGNDMKRTQRQRVVINKIVDKAKKKPFSAIESIITKILPNCRTSIAFEDILSYAANMKYYQIEKTTGFPFTHLEKNCTLNGVWSDPVVPVTLATNVKTLHEFLFEDTEYTPSVLVETFSRGIEEISGLTEESMQTAEQNSIIENSGGEADIVN